MRLSHSTCERRLLRNRLFLRNANQFAKSETVGEPANTASEAVVPMIIETERLHLRSVEERDAPAIQDAASHREIADTMISLPYPYPSGEAGRYIAQCQMEQTQGRSITLSIEDSEERHFCGLIEVREIDREHSQAELSFWLAPEAWGRGYMTEVVEAVLKYVFDDLGLNRLYAYHMQRNPASGQVLAKNGFTQEGLLRQRVMKWGKFEDVALWALLKDEWS